jgi:hypothetical protein
MIEEGPDNVFEHIYSETCQFLPFILSLSNSSQELPLLRYTSLQALKSFSSDFPNPSKRVSTSINQAML